MYGSQRSLNLARCCCIPCLAVGLAIQNGTWASSCPTHSAAGFDNVAESRTVGSSRNLDVDDTTSVLQISGEVTAAEKTASWAAKPEFAAAPPMLGMIDVTAQTTRAKRSRIAPPIHAATSIPGTTKINASRVPTTLANIAESISEHFVSFNTSMALPSSAMSQPAKAQTQPEVPQMVSREGNNGTMLERGWWHRMPNLASLRSLEEAFSFSVYAANLYSAVKRDGVAPTVASDGTWLFMLFLVLLSLACACLLARNRSPDAERRGQHAPGFHTPARLMPRGSTHGGMVGRPETGRLPVNNDGSRRSLSTLEPKMPPSMGDLYNRMQPLSPRLMSRSSLTPSRLNQNLRLADHSLRGKFDSFFAIPAAQLPADCGSVGEFDVLRGSLRKTILHGSVQFTDAGLRWVGLSLPGTNGLLASCWPSPGSCPIADGHEVEPCAEVQICDQAGDIWGTLSPKGQDSYGIYKGDRRVLTLAGDRPAGRLAIFLDSEPLAHAARGRTGEHLEIGVKPPCDPILMLTCLLAVVVLNPEQEG
mmetsp:Transcript_71040/g.141128  ORF Transcript_71040/g.141128 Transcript_71040/m.141128 type:complete len:533 (-) Transcript_71040:69-1667(-)